MIYHIIWYIISYHISFHITYHITFFYYYIYNIICCISYYTSYTYIVYTHIIHIYFIVPYICTIYIYSYLFIHIFTVIDWNQKNGSLIQLIGWIDMRYLRLRKPLPIFCLRYIRWISWNRFNKPVGMLDWME